MYPVLFTIGDFSFYTHGVLAVTGIIAATAVTYVLARKHLDCTYLLDNMVYATLFGIIGARVTYFVLYREQFSSFSQIFRLWEGGLVSYGGFIMGAIAYAVMLRLLRQPILKWFDFLAISFPLGLAIGRIGDYFAGEDYGVATTSSLALRGRVPLHLYEAGMSLLIFVLLFILNKKVKNKPDGLFFTASVALYSGGRFALDFWREETTLALGLSLGQVTSLILFIAAIFALIRLSIHKQKGSHDFVSGIFRKAKKGSA